MNAYNYEMYEEQTKNLSIDEINFAGDMFTALNVCPSDFSRIYTKIIINGTVSKIIKLSVNMMKKSPSDFKSKAKSIFSKIMSVLNLKFTNLVKDFKNETKGTEFHANASNVIGIPMLDIIKYQ